MKETEIREVAECVLCRQPFGAAGRPMFWRVRLTRYVVDAAAVRRQSGLAMAMGSARLAAVMGPDEDMASVVSEVTVTVCEGCAAKATSVYELGLEVAGG